MYSSYRAGGTVPGLVPGGIYVDYESLTFLVFEIYSFLDCIFFFILLKHITDPHH